MCSRVNYVGHDMPFEDVFVLFYFDILQGSFAYDVSQEGEKRALTHSDSFVFLVKDYYFFLTRGGGGRGVKFLYLYADLILK